MVETETKMHKGFLIIRCEKCGRERAFRSRAGTAAHRCFECRWTNVLRDMAAVRMKCQNCGKEWTYKTNSTQAEVAACCVACGTEMTAVWSPTDRQYLPRKGTR